ncbi:hypothetical protein LWI28_004328 [Acer negundo]|uniref:Uncharacterized protein n=1 Tax=Acer negundo TaxID=4023 RepID=A0AAD5JCD6_ACENE|nr:hypothetical protein LWI28_004328 [Acer negundo]
MRGAPVFEEGGIQLCVDLSENVSLEKETEVSRMVSKEKGTTAAGVVENSTLNPKHTKRYVKSHPMITIGSRSRAKESASDGQLKDLKNRNSKASYGTWNVDEEVAKVLETGAALRFDFNGNEEEIVEVVSSRKREDEKRMEGQDS